MTTGAQDATASIAGGQWNSSASGVSITSAIRTNDNVYGQATGNGQFQAWNNFGFNVPPAGNPPVDLSLIPVPAANQTIVIRGIEVRLEDAFLSNSM